MAAALDQIKKASKLAEKEKQESLHQYGDLESAHSW